MRDMTNLSWPEAPFGAGHRPFGKRSAMLMALGFSWKTGHSAEPILVAAATVYLRVRRDGKPLAVTDTTLAIGFRITAVETSADLQPLLGLVDRAISRGRRHAAIVAGHDLEQELARLGDLSSEALRGVDGLRTAWTARSDKQAGIARMVDTAVDVSPSTVSVQLSDDVAKRPSVPFRDLLAQSLATGLASAAYLDRYRWDGTFRAPQALDRAGWDLLSGVPAERSAGGIGFGDSGNLTSLS